MWKRDVSNGLFVVVDRNQAFSNSNKRKPSVMQGTEQCTSYRYHISRAWDQWVTTVSSAPSNTFKMRVLQRLDSINDIDHKLEEHIVFF